MILFKKLFCIVLLLIFMIGCSVTEISKKEKLLILAQYEELTVGIKKQKQICLEATNKTNPNKIAIDNPEFFGGIKPGSKYWPEVEKIYSTYVNTACNYLNEDKVLEKFIEIYSAEMSDDVLDEILSFYKTKTGMDYLKQTRSGKDRLRIYYAESTTPAYEKAMNKYTEDLGSLVRKCHCENRFLRIR